MYFDMIYVPDEVFIDQLENDFNNSPPPSELEQNIVGDTVNTSPTLLDINNTSNHREDFLSLSCNSSSSPTTSLSKDDDSIFDKNK